MGLELALLCVIPSDNSTVLDQVLDRLKEWNGARISTIVCYTDCLDLALLCVIPSVNSTVLDQVLDRLKGMEWG